MTIRGDILREALLLVEGDRQAAYGDPSVGLACAAELKAVYRRYADGAHPAGHDEAIEALLLKVARIATGSWHRDNYVDIAGYAALAWECDPAWHSLLGDKSLAEQDENGKA